MMYFATSIGEDIKFAALGTIRTLLLTLCEFIYQSIYFCYNLFQRIGNAQIMDSTAVQSLYQKVGLLLGLYMIFRLTFSFIQYILNPDSMTDKQKGMGNVIKKVLIVIVLLGITPTIFKTAYSLQRLIINENVIPKLITGYSTSEENFGGELTWYLFSSFYKQDEEVTPNDGEECPELDSDLIGAYIKDDADFSYAYNCLNNRGENVSTSEESFVIVFNGFFALAAGIAVLWMIVSYTISVGVRLIQLAYLQLVAPIPIMMYLEPKEDGTFKKWVKQCTTTYIDFFLRTAIIFFTITIIQVIMKTGTGTFYDSVGGFASKGEALYTQIIMIIALMVFAKKVPDLLKELFPMSGGAASLGFGLSNKTAKGLATFGAGAAVGAIGGVATGIAHGKGTLTGRVGNAFTGLFRGAASGAKTKGNVFSNARKGMANQRTASQRAYERNNDGSTWMGRNLGARDAARTKEAFDNELSLYSDYNAVADGIDKELEKSGEVQAAMAAKQALMERASRGGIAPSAREITDADEEIKLAKKRTLQAEIASGTNGKLMGMLANAEAIRAKGEKNGYDGFTSSSLASGTDADRTEAFFDNKKRTGTETNEIKGAGGSRNEEYKKAEANAKYYKTK